MIICRGDNMEILIYAKYDINMSIIDIRSNIFLSDTEGYTQIDKYEPIMLLDTESNESDRRYMYAHADNGEYIQMVHGKPLFDDKGRPNFHDNFVEWTEEEKEAKYPTPEPSPSDIEVLKEENKLLKAQVEALSERGDFVEDCMAEMAMVIYA